MEKKFTFINHGRLLEVSEGYTAIKRSVGLLTLRAIQAELFRVIHADDREMNWLEKVAPALCHAIRGGGRTEAELLDFIQSMHFAHRIEAVVSIGAFDKKACGFCLEVRCFKKGQPNKAAVPTVRVLIEDNGRYQKVEFDRI